MGELEELAAKGRDPKPDRPTRQSEAAFRSYLAERNVTESLAAEHASRMAPLVVGGSCVALAGLVALVAPGWLIGVAVPGLLLTAVVGGFLAWRWSEKRGVGAAVAWMQGIPWDFDIEGYLRGLAGARMNTVVRVKVAFAEAPSAEERALFADACKGAVEVESVEWRGRTLHVQSGRIPSYFTPRDADSYYRNHAVHQWVRRLLDGAVKPMHARAEVQRVRVELRD